MSDEREVGGGPVKLFLTYERPSALPAACAPAHVHRVGLLTVQLQEPKTRIQGISGRTAKATGMVEAPFAGVDISGVPPRGKPV
jgi:hypothetical protein